jgi:hypothetical protein
MRCSIPSESGLLFGFAVAIATAACGGALVADPFTEAPPPMGPLNDAWSPDEILRPEIVSRGNNDLTAMALIRRLRPAWLRARGQNSLTDPGTMYPVVYIDEIRHGRLETLHQIPSSEILSMQFIGTADATTRWGTGHTSGVINVVTGR